MCGLGVRLCVSQWVSGLEGECIYTCMHVNTYKCIYKHIDMYMYIYTCMATCTLMVIQ